VKQEFISKKECLITELISECVIGISKNNIKRLIKDGEVKLNGEKQKTDVILKKGDLIAVFIPKAFVQNASGLIDNVKIVYEDDNILICHKPKGMDCENNLYSIIANKYPFAILNHRLDRQTDGLVIFSLNQHSYNAVCSALKNQTIEKYYYAAIKGKFNKDGTHTAFLTKNSADSFVKISDNQTKDSKKIISHFKLIKQQNDNLCVIEAMPITGKTHQLRAHLAFLGHPILGDTKYGLCKNPPLHLSSYKIIFRKMLPPLEYLNEQTVKIPLNIFDKTIFRRYNYLS